MYVQYLRLWKHGILSSKLLLTLLQLRRNDNLFLWALLTVKIFQVNVFEYRYNEILWFKIQKCLSLKTVPNLVNEDVSYIFKVFFLFYCFCFAAVFCKKKVLKEQKE